MPADHRDIWPVCGPPFLIRPRSAHGRPTVADPGHAQTASVRPVNPDTLVQAVVAVVASLASLGTFFSRRRRLRNEIRDNLTLIQELDKDEFLKTNSPVAMWLRGKVTIDVARLVGQPLGSPKKPIPSSSVVFSSILCVGFGFWAYYIDRDKFSWVSLIPAVVSFLFGVSIYGMFINREIPPDAEEGSPATEDGLTTGAQS